MGFVDYTLNVIRSLSDLVHFLFYLFLVLTTLILAFYINFREDCDTKFNEVIEIWIENSKLLTKSARRRYSVNIPFKPYGFGRYDFLFQSGRLPYFMYTSQLYKNKAKARCKELTKIVKDFFKNKK